MTSGIERSHGKPRVRVRRSRRSTPATVDVSAVLAGPLKDPQTGRFLPGNQAGRLRALKTGPKLATMNPEACAGWLRPYVEDAHERARDLVVEMGAEVSPSLMAYAEDAATADSIHRAMLAIAADPEADPKTRTDALKEARAWLNEKRQSITTMRVEARSKMPPRAEPYQSPTWSIPEEPKQ